MVLRVRQALLGLLALLEQRAQPLLFPARLAPQEHKAMQARPDLPARRQQLQARPEPLVRLAHKAFKVILAPPAHKVCKVFRAFKV